jgi:uncharacterized protein YkwD
MLSLGGRRKGKALFVAGLLSVMCLPGLIWAAAAEIPWSDGFESGNLASCWTSTSTRGGRVLVTKTNLPHSGAYHVIMDSYYQGYYYALNELILTVNLAGKSGMNLSFWSKALRDRPNVLPNSFTGSYKGDGVSISADGTRWFKVQGLTSGEGIGPTWKKFEASLDAAAAKAGIQFNGAFKIKFQQYDARAVPYAGLAFDDIQISQTQSPPQPPPVSDADGDGLPDTWEMVYFGNLEQWPDGDYDGDGFTNLEEFRLGKEPTHSDAQPLVAAAPFAEGFETELGDHWATRTIGSARMLRTSMNGPASGSYHLTMDSPRQGVSGLNELILTIDLSRKSSVFLGFRHKTFDTEADTLPNAFTGSLRGDGVAISSDGLRWYKIQGLTTAEGGTSVWKRYDIDLEAAAARAGIGFTSGFKIKFQTGASAPIPYSGAAFDEISIQTAVQPPSPVPDELLPQEAELIRLVNQQRAQNGLSSLQTSLALSEAARRHSTDMAMHNIFSHTGSDGSSPWDRIRATGYRLGAGGETVGGGYATPSDMVNGWMNSPGHRAILLGSYCEVGAGYAAGGTYRYYWTMDFGCQY